MITTLTGSSYLTASNEPDSLAILPQRLKNAVDSVSGHTERGIDPPVQKLFDDNIAGRLRHRRGPVRVEEAASFLPILIASRAPAARARSKSLPIFDSSGCRRDMQLLLHM